MQQLLLAGDRAEACRVAAATHQWSHALLLAQFCGPEVYPQQTKYAKRREKKKKKRREKKTKISLILNTYASTITNFATTVLPEGSPLRTMYLLYGRQPQEIFRTTGTNNSSFSFFLLFSTLFSTFFSTLFSTLLCIFLSFWSIQILIKT